MTTYTTKMSTPARFVMVENEEGTFRYEFFSQEILESNVSNKIAYYRPCVRRCRKLIGGSTQYEEQTSIEQGNELYKKLLADGWKVVTKRAFA